MDKKTGAGGTGRKGNRSASSLEITTDSRQAGKGSDESGIKGSWIREDGAICFDNECIVLQPGEGGQLALTYDPDKCSCEETNSAILDALVECAMSGKGINLIVKPRVNKS